MTLCALSLIGQLRESCEVFNAFLLSYDFFKRCLSHGELVSQRSCEDKSNPFADAASSVVKSRVVGSV
jgi:hypothetical protein